MLEELAADERDVVGEVTVRPDGHDDRQPVGAADLHVVRAERRGLVHQAGAVLGGDVVREHDEVGGRATLLDRRELDQLERALVGPALHLRAGHRPLDRPALAERRAEQRLGHDQLLVAVGREHVGHVGPHRHGRVGHEGPRRRRPHQQRGSLLRPRTRGQREAHVDAGVGDRLVALGDLVVGEARLVAGAVRRDPVVLDQQALAVDLLEGPPDRLDVLGVHRAVGLPHVDPAAHPVGHLLPEVHVALHRLTAALVELRDAEGLDVGLAGEAELLLDGELDRQAVAVPAALAVDLVALHRPEPREDVLEGARLDVVGARSAVGRRRALVEGPARRRPRCGRRTSRRSAARARSPARHARAWGGRPAGAPGGTGSRVVLRRLCRNLRRDEVLCAPRGTTLLGRPRARRPTHGPPLPVLVSDRRAVTFLPAAPR